MVAMMVSEAHVFHIHTPGAPPVFVILLLIYGNTRVNNPTIHVHITHPGGRTCGRICATDVVIHAYYIIILTLGNEDMHHSVRIVVLICNK